MALCLFVLFCFDLIWFLIFWDRIFLYNSLNVLELTWMSLMASRSETSICLCLLNAGIKGISHHLQDVIFVCLLFNLLFSHIIQLARRLLHFLPVCLHCPLLIHCSSISFEKIPGLPGIATKLCLRSCNKTSHKPSYQAWTRQPSRKKKGPLSRKKIQRHHHSHY